MKIALVQMPPNPRDTPPYDVALTCANLRRAGHEVAVLDSNNDIYHQVYKQRPYWKFRMSSHADEPAAALFEQKPELFHGEVRRILDLHPDVVVFRTENGLVNAMAAARLLRDRSPKTPILSSGALTADKRVLNAWKTSECFSDDGRYNLPFDYHIVGEDDLVLSPVIEILASGDRAALARRFDVHGKVIDAINSPIVDNLDDLPFYDFTDFDFMRYADPKMLRINVSRSCVKHCAFCIDWIITRKFRCMSGDRWFDEYRCQLKRHPHLLHIRHYDRLLNGDIPALARFTDRMLAAYDRPVVNWGGDCVITPEMTGDLLQKMARAGCNNLGVGFESGSARVRKSMDKDFFTNEMARRFFADCKRFGITATMNVLLGFPTETEQDFQESLDFIALNKENLHEVRITFPTLHVAPGSAMSSVPSRFNLADTHDDKWVSRDGANDYVGRIGRFERLCRRMVDLNVTLAVNRRPVKTQAAVTNLVKELLPAAPAQPVRPPIETEQERGMRAANELTSSDLPLAEKAAKAEALLERFSAEPAVLSRLHLFRGKICVVLGRYEEARRHLAIVLDRCSEDDATAIEVGLQLVDIDARAERWGDVRRRCEGLLPKVSGNPRRESEVLMFLGRVHFEAGDAAGSLAHLEVLMSRYPDSLNPAFYSAGMLRLMVLQSMGRHAEAMAAGDSLLLEYQDSQDKQVEIELQLADLDARSGKWENVRRRCEALLSKEDGNPRRESSILMFLARASFEVGDMQGSMSHIESLMSRYPDSSNLDFYRARLLRLRVLQSMGSHAEAMAAGGKLLLEYQDSQEKQVEIELQLAELDESSGKWENVRRRCEALLSKEGGNPRRESPILMFLARASFEVGDMQGSLSHIENLMGRYADGSNPDFYRASLLRLSVFQIMGRHAEAIAASGELLLEYPDSQVKQAAIRLRLAQICKEAGESERALELFHEVAGNSAAHPEDLARAKMNIDALAPIRRKDSSVVETAKEGMRA
jgi:tetratricopeptide (TPR) repeat protein